MTRDEYLDKEACEHEECLPDDYQKFLEDDPYYEEWLDELSRTNESTFPGQEDPLESGKH
jgi:hypothetical protein